MPPASGHNKAVVLPESEDDCEICITPPPATHVEDTVVPSPKVQRDGAIMPPAV